MTKRRKPKAVKVRKPMPPPSKVIPADKKRRIQQDILRQLREIDSWQDGPDPIPPHTLK
jgi:hypothetical protein